jgi:hypothetical protein
MLTLPRTLADSTDDLVPPGRFRWQLAGLVVVGAGIPVTELMVTKVFTDLITEDVSAAPADLAPELALFLALFVATRVAHYAQRMYRVTFFERVFQARGGRRAASLESWQWAQALELLTILTALVQILVMAGFFVLLAPAFGLVNGVLVLLLLHVVGVLFRRQLGAQRSYVERRRANEDVPPSVRVRSRIASAEAGGLASSIGVLVLLVLLLGLTIGGSVGAATAIVLFLGLRMQNSTFSTLSAGAMRLARARAVT